MRKRAQHLVIVGATLLLAVLLVAVAQPPPVPEGVVVPEELLLDERCVTHELNIPGQDVYLSGTTVNLPGSRGPLVLEPITVKDPTGKYPDATLLPDAIEAVIQLVGQPPAPRPYLPNVNTFSAVDFMNRDVVIVVADDFGGGHYRLPEALDSSRAGTVTAEQIADMDARGDLSHGALVMHHLNAAIASLGVFGKDVSASDEDRTVWVQREVDHRLVVSALDLSDVAHGPRITTGAVVEALMNRVRLRIDDAREVSDPQGVVVNMSWVFLPCKTVEDFLADRDAYDTFEDYLRGVGVDLDNQSISDVIAALAAVDDPDLVGILDESTDMYPSYFGVEGFGLVAASGNYSLPYQMLPAGWSQVVGAAVHLPGPRDFPPGYSNEGDVTLPGEWNVYQPLDPDGNLGAATPLAYGGTSFAAPLVSLYLALDMAREVHYCVHQPPAPPPLAPGPTLNVPLADAIGNC